MTLATRPLGTSGLDITPVGLGAWAIGGGDWKYGWGTQDDRDSVAAIRRAAEVGVNWIDTAAIYGIGHSEEVVGRALREMPAGDRPLVFTKCGRVADPGRPDDEPTTTLAPASVRRELEASLRRLGVERIDLYQFHWPDPGTTPLEDSWGEMARFVDEGKVRAIGVANFTVELLDRAEAIRHVDSVQPPFSAIRRDSGADVIPWAAAHGSGVIVYSPMQSGLLTDTFTRERVAAMGERDWRRSHPNFGEPRLSANLALRDALAPIAARHRTTVSAIAIAWTLAWPGVTGAIVGARSAPQIDGWIGGASVRLEADDLAEIEAAIEATGAGSGPARPVVG